MIIAITGLCRSGKDEIANYLVHRYSYRNVKIAECLKTVVKTLFDMSEDQVEGVEKDQMDTRWGVTPRQAMQFLGTEMMQYKIQELLPHIGRTFWIRQLCNKLDGTHVAISDVRFIHEVNELKRVFGNRIFIIKVIRDAALAQCSYVHASDVEWQYIKEDALVENNGSIEELQSKIDDIMTKFS